MKQSVLEYLVLISLGLPVGTHDYCDEWHTELLVLVYYTTKS
jgi:hypothetical protein